MIDPSESVYYLAFGFTALGLVVAYIRIKSEEGVVITTKEFQWFQGGFISGYSAVIFCELIAAASFFHTFSSLHLSLLQITKLYLTTVISSTVTQVLNEMIDIGAKRDKCVLAALLYSVSMFSVFFGGHYEMLLMGRILYGVAQAFQNSAFEAYALQEHSSRGFPEDWLTHTFGQLTHSMTLVSLLSGVVGQAAAGTGRLGCVALCCVGFGLAALFLLAVWEKDVSLPRFMVSGFLFNLNQSLASLKTNRQLLLLVVTSSLAESSIAVFSFYWAPWLTGLVKEEDRRLPYEIVFATLVACSMAGHYLFQIFVGKAALVGVDQVFQGSLLVSSAAFFLGAVASTPLVAFLVALAVQLCVGLYWPCVGYFRGRIIASELRSSSLVLPKVLTLLLTLLVLSSIHHSPLLMLTACALMNGGAAYIQFFYLDSRQALVSDDLDDDEEEEL